MLASNGVVHVIDTVLLLPEATTAEPLLDIVALASATDALSTLVQAVSAADLVTTLQGEGPFTVLAPTNDAFDSLPAGTLTTLLRPENKATLAGILTYHVIPGRVLSSDLKDGAVVETVNGESLTVRLQNGKVMFVGGTTAMVVTPDVLASNGVVHVIDTVLLLPESPTTSGPLATSTSSMSMFSSSLSFITSKPTFSTLSNLLTRAGLDATLTASAPVTVFAPTNAGFNKLGAQKLSALQAPSGRQELTNTLRRHIVSGDVVVTALRSGDRLRTLSGEFVTVSRSRRSGELMIGGVAVGAATTSADGSMVYEVDGVMTPASQDENPDSSVTDDSDSTRRTVAIVVPVVVATVVIVALLAVVATRRRRRASFSTPTVVFSNPVYNQDPRDYHEA